MAIPVLDVINTPHMLGVFIQKEKKIQLEVNYRKWWTLNHHSYTDDSKNSYWMCKKNP